MIINLRVTLLSLGLCLPIHCAHAVNYFFPTASTGTLATAPLTMANTDTFTVNSGTFSTSNDTSNFTVFLAATSTVTVASGAVISFNGSNATNASIAFNAAATAISIVNNGTINSLNNTYAISIQNPGAAGTAVTVTNTGTINGNNIINGQNTVTINLNGNSVINGNLDLPTTGSTINVGPTTPAVLSSATSAPSVALLDVFANSVAYLTKISAITTLNIRSNATAYVNGPLYAGTAGGAITNAGILFINTDIFKTGTFTNTGVVVVDRPVSISTSSYVSGAGIHRIVLGDLNTYGKTTFNSSTNTVFSNFQVTTLGGYFPASTITLVNVPLGITTAPTSYTVPSPTLFLRFATPVVVGNEIQMTLTRTPFQTYAVNNTNKEIGVSIETMGSASPANGLGQVSPSSSMVNILNAVERSTTVPQLNAALSQLAPMISAPIYNLEMQEQMMNPTELRLAQAKTYASGDTYCDTTLWVRPFTDQANQNLRGATQGYYATATGVAVGYDRYIFRNFLLGFAGSYADAHVQDKVNSQSSTSIKSLQLMLYGTYDISKYTYFNWIMAASDNSFVAQRYVNINNLFHGIANSSYHNQLIAMKGVWGKNYSYGDYLMLTPEASLYGAISNKYEYSENGSTAANLNVSTPSSTVAQLGLGGRTTTPFEFKNMVFIPEISAYVLNNIATADQTAISTFAEGGTFISANFNLPRWGFKYGAAITIFNQKHTQIKINYAHTGYSGYTDNAFYLTAKYVF